jgi:hypothetical protein
MFFAHSMEILPNYVDVPALIFTVVESYTIAILGSAL